MKKLYFFHIIIFLFFLFFSIFFNLGKRPLFGVEGRWAEAAREMTLKGSWFLPTINFEPHITKPLIPFWLIKVSGELFGYSEFSVRLPGSLLALFSVLLLYLLSKKLLEKRGALAATFLYSASLGFVEFARLAQSEIYQLFGIVSATCVYVYFRDKKSFLGYFLFFLALLWGALSKGLTAVAVITLFVMLDILLHKKFYHFNWKLIVSCILGIFLYFLPYYLTSLELNTALPFYLWFKENIKQAIDPYDNLRPFYIYFFYLPLWIAPFSLYLYDALYKFFKNYTLLSKTEKVFLLTTISIFLLFTLSKARRGYYILPILPFSILLITFYLKNYPYSYLTKVYRILSHFIPFLTLSTLFIILKLRLTLNFETIFIILFFTFLQILLLICIYKFHSSILTLILLFFSIEALFYGYIQPEFSKSTEKLSGEFVYKFIELNPKLKLCYFSKEESPVANFYFYARITQRMEKYDNFSLALRACDLIVVRKAIEENWKDLAKEGNFDLIKFENPKDRSKSYYIFYNSSTLKTPSL